MLNAFRNLCCFDSHNIIYGNTALPWNEPKNFKNFIAGASMNNYTKLKNN